MTENEFVSQEEQNSAMKDILRYWYTETNTWQKTVTTKFSYLIQIKNAVGFEFKWLSSDQMVLEVFSKQLFQLTLVEYSE